MERDVDGGIAGASAKAVFLPNELLKGIATINAIGTKPKRIIHHV